MVDIPDAHRVVAGTFVTTEDGTGLVHLAPAFGADDLAAIRANGMPVVNPVRADGRFEEGLPLVGGLFFKDADEPLIADLAERGLLLRSEPHVHSYPHCWRCGTALLYYALPSWYIRTTAIKDQLLAREREDQLAAAHDQERPVRRVAAQQRGLGAVADPVLGHAAADLGLPVGPRDLRRVARRTGRARRARPVGARPAPAVRGRRHFPVPGVRRPPRRGCPR